MKRFSIGLVAVLMAIGFAAFTVPQKTVSKTFGTFYKYNGTTGAGENVAANYSVDVSGQGSCMILEDDLICKIESSYAPDQYGHPQFPSSLDYNARADANNIIRFWKEQ